MPGTTAGVREGCVAQGALQMSSMLVPMERVAHPWRTADAIARHLALAAIGDIVNSLWRGNTVPNQVILEKGCSALHHVAAPRVAAC